MYQASKILEGGLLHLVSEDSEMQGVKVLSAALKSPIRNVIENKLAIDCGHIINKIDQEGNFFAGFDVKRGKET